MPELMYNNQYGSLVASGTDVTNSTTASVIHFASPPDFATIVSPNFVKLGLNPGTSTYEIVYLTAYTSGSVAGTVLRAAEDGVNWPAVTHPNGTWVCAPSQQTFTAQQIGGNHSSKLQGWFAALANRNFAKTNIVCIGDSITEGQGATNESYRWTERLHQLINTRFPCITQPVGGRGFLAPVLAGTNTFSASVYVTVAGTPAELQGFGLNCFTYDLSATSGCTLTYSLVGDSADILWTGNPGNGSFRWKVDSGSFTTVSTSATFTDGYITHVSLGSAGAHTLVVQWLSGGVTAVDGIIEYNGDFASGIQVHNGGHFGSSTGFWTDNDIVTGWPSAIAAVNPGLVIIELGSNDPGSAISPSSTYSNLQSIVSGIQSAFTTSPPILLVAAYPNQGNDAVWPQYVSKMYALAATSSTIDVLDLTLRMPSTLGSPLWGLYYADDVHPSNEGHEYIADAICQYISPS